VTSMIVCESFKFYEDVVFGSHFSRVLFVLAPDLRSLFGFLRLPPPDACWG
jgi:hypothetical protein